MLDFFLKLLDLLKMKMKISSQTPMVINLVIQGFGYHYFSTNLQQLVDKFMVPFKLLKITNLVIYDNKFITYGNYLG